VERLRHVGPSPEDCAQERLDGQRTRDHIAAAMDVLSSRERWILERRILTDNEATLEALGRTLGISKERVRQIEARALEKLRDRLEAMAA
jgi:RNA polymerase sigma-32 factor